MPSLFIALLVGLLPLVGPHDPDGRLADLAARIARAPHDAALRVERGRLFTALGNLAAARADLDLALRGQPANGPAVAALAAVEYFAGDDLAALELCQRAQALGQTDCALQRLHGRVLAALGRDAEAAPRFAAALARRERGEPSEYLELAASLERSGNVVAARLVLDRGLRALGPAVALVDAAVALDLASGRADAALARLETLRAFVQRPEFLASRIAAVTTSTRALSSARAPASPAAIAVSAPDAVPLYGPWLPPATTVLVPLGAQWRYHDLGVLPAFHWHLPAFDDAAWPEGPAQLGYGDGDEATVVASGPPGAANPTLWFRHAFDLEDSAIPPSARVRVLCDDGCAVYVNGVEVGRWNLHNGPVSAFSPASIAVSGSDENAFHVFAFDPALLVGGRNVIAVEVHQVGPTSSDASFDCELLGGQGPISVLRGPYLQNGTPTSACVQWRTDQATATRLWLGPSPAALQPVFFDATLRTEHTATIGGLQPETTYCYAIGDATGVFTTAPAATLRTLPPPGAVRPFRAWVLGDAGFGWLPQYAVRDLYSTFAAGRRADAILLLGDNAYFVGTDREYQVGLFDVYGELLRDTFTWSTLGNHDSYSASTATGTGPYYDIFTLPRSGEAGGLPSGTEAYYSFDRGHVHFVCLDSMDSDRSAAGAMMTWLAADLANTNARWIIAFFHHPPYSAGSHHSDNPWDSGGRLYDMRQIALPILEAGGVDLVLSGHSHAYERSFLLDGHYGASATLQPTMRLDQGDGRPAGDGFYGKPTAGKAPHEGAVYVVAGSAGSVGGGSLDHPAMHVSLNNLGSFVFDVDGDRLDAKFVGLTGIEDEFTLVKGDTRSLHRVQPTISVATGGRQDYRLAAGPAHAGHVYVLAGAQGTSPGITLLGMHVPLNADAWFALSLALANSAVYPQSIGILDANGKANAALVLPPLSDPALVGASLWHAYVVGDGTALLHASNAVRMTFVP